MIYVVAYFANNLGDDLFVRYLLRRYPTTQFYLCSSNPLFLDCFKSEKNAHIISRLECYYIRLINKIKGYKGPFRNYRVFNKAVATVRIGGSIFIEDSNWRERNIYGEGKNLFIIGSNFGPYYTGDYKLAVERIISHSIDCCFRDKYSYETFQHIKQTRYAPDLLFGHHCDDLKVFEEYEYVGVCVIDFSNRKMLTQYLQIYENTIVDLCNYYLNKGKSIRFLSFCSHEGDDNAIERIRKKLPEREPIELVQYTGNMDSFLNEFRKCTVIIATRFHAMILGWKYRKRVLPIIYSEKMLHVIQDLKFNGVYWNVLSGDTAPINSLDEIKALDEELLASLVEKSDEHFRGLDKFLCNYSEEV